ncbi:hypothetical protein [Halobaculum sp. P14]|uniref:hypothetical protein n=1 Tax=Halobaculum sp. P14 TaxID=3421638 RepID=UPI003EB9B1C6
MTFTSTTVPGVGRRFTLDGVGDAADATDGTPAAESLVAVVRRDGRRELYRCRDDAAERVAVLDERDATRFGVALAGLYGAAPDFGDRGDAARRGDASNPGSDDR